MKRLLWLFLLIFSCACSVTTSVRDSRRLIEWGWDTPKLQQISAILPAAQNLPFDGLVTDVEVPSDSRGLSWTLISWTPVDSQLLHNIAAQYHDLAWGRLSNNFLRLTMFPDPNSKWFEDLNGGWDVVEDNVRQWAALAQALGFKGIMLDVEQYGAAHLFDYSRQPDANQIAFDDYARQVYQRGQDFMIALQTGYPGLIIMSTYFLASTPSADPSRYTLLKPFIEGMISTADAATTLVDGYEGAYIYKEEGQFRWARDQMLNVKPQFTPRSDFGHPLGVGFGLWIDPVCGDGGLPPEGCGFTPGEFSAALSHAMTYSDRYVWIYSEKINWYTGQGIPLGWQDALKAFRNED